MSSAPIVVTTRSRLRGRRHVPLMTLATRRILREMRTTPGAREVLSLVASPREFWSVSVWSSHHLMQEFMRSGAHGTYMWEVSRWLESFWLMRWRPEAGEIGRWRGRRLAAASAPAPAPATEAQTSASRQRRDAALAAIPALRLAFGDGQAPTYAHAPDTRWQRTLVAGTAGALLRLPTRVVRRAPPLGGLLAGLRSDRDLLRCVHGRAQGRDGGTYLLCLFASDAARDRLLEGDWVAAAARAHGDDLWVCPLTPEHEFGHWDGLRVRDQGPIGAPATWAARGERP